MTARLKFGLRHASALAGLALIFALGCGEDDGIGRRYRVKGTVTYKGEPLKDGVIHFVPPTDGLRAAMGKISDGGYYLTTHTDGDGALPGKYQVTITSKVIDLSKAIAANKGGGGSLMQDEIAKAVRSAKNLIPPKYSLPQTSGLTAEVKAEANTIDFDLSGSREDLEDVRPVPRRPTRPPRR
jgi:hypothetical protein